MKKRLNIIKRIKTFDDAVNELGNDHPFVKAYNALNENGFANQKDVLAFLKLRIITAALNEGWEPQFTENEDRYRPIFWSYTQKQIGYMSKYNRDKLSLLDKPIGIIACFYFAYSYHMPSVADTDVGSRLCFKSKELADYAGKQFVDIYNDYYLK